MGSAVTGSEEFGESADAGRVEHAQPLERKWLFSRLHGPLVGRRREQVSGSARRRIDARVVAARRVREPWDGMTERPGERMLSFDELTDQRVIRHRGEVDVRDGV
jgi:hypothetical protein